MVFINLTASFPPNLIESSRFSWVLGTTPAKCDLSTDFADLEMMDLTDLDNISKIKVLKSIRNENLNVTDNKEKSEIGFGSP